MHVHAAKLGAAVQRRKHLTRVQPVIGVERALDPLLLFEIGYGYTGLTTWMQSMQRASHGAAPRSELAETS